MLVDRPASKELRVRPVWLIPLALCACGGTTGYEPYQPPANAYDLNATPYTITVYGSKALMEGLHGRTVNELDIVAKMRDAQGYAPTVKLPSDPKNPLVVNDLGTPLQEDGSGQPTPQVVLAVYPSGYIDVQVTAKSDGTAVGMQCANGQAVNAIPDPKHPDQKPGVRIVLTPDVRASCLPN
jgi:hypothetical protein